MGEDPVSLLQQAIVKPDLLTFFRTLNSLDSSFDTQTESAETEETVLATFVQLTEWHDSHRDVLEALLARGFDPTYATSQYFNPSEELDGMPEELHDLLSRAPDGFKPNERVQRLLDTPLDRLEEALKEAPPAAIASSPIAIDTELAINEQSLDLHAGLSATSSVPQLPTPLAADPVSDATMTYEPFAGYSLAASAAVTTSVATSPAGKAMSPPKGWNEECERLKMPKPACAMLFVQGICRMSKCRFDHEPLPASFQHEDVLPSSARRPDPVPMRDGQGRVYEPIGSQTVPPPGWRAAWTACGGIGAPPCAHHFLLDRCKRNDSKYPCAYSHAPLPLDFYHVNLPPDAPRVGDAAVAEEPRERSRSPVAPEPATYVPHDGTTMPPSGWDTAWRAAGERGAPACAYYFINGRCVRRDRGRRCPFSHDPLPRNFHHVNLPPDAPRQGDEEWRDRRRGRSRSPISRSDRYSSEYDRPSRKRSQSRSRSRDRHSRRSPSSEPNEYASRRRRRSRSPSKDRHHSRRRSPSPRSSDRRSEGFDRRRDRSRSPLSRSMLVDDDDKREANGMRRRDLIRLNGPEVFQKPTRDIHIYKTQYCFWRDRGCRYRAVCKHAHTERELLYYQQKKWMELEPISEVEGAPAESSPALPRSPTLRASQPIPLREPDLSSLEGLGLSEQQKQLIGRAIQDPSVVQALQVSLAAKQTSAEQAQAAMSDPTPMFPDDAAQENRYRDYLRHCAGQGSAQAHLEPALSKIASYNEQVQRWTEQVATTSVG